MVDPDTSRLQSTLAYRLPQKYRNELLWNIRLLTCVLA